MKRVDALHPRPFVAAQASALWFSLTHCLAAAMSGALTILPALLAMLSIAGISLRLLLVSFCWPRADRRGAGRAVWLGRRGCATRARGDARGDARREQPRPPNRGGQLSSKDWS